MESIKNIRPQSSTDSIDLNKLQIIIRTNWIWILMILLAVNAIAYLYIRYTKNIYESESQLKLDIKQDASELGIKNFVTDEKLNIVAGEIEIIQSELFLNRVLDYSNFEISFYSEGRILNDELFTKGPARVTYHSKDHSIYNYPISFEEIDPSTFRLRLAAHEVEGRYGEKVTFDKLQLIVERNPDFKKGDEIGYFFVINSRDVLLNYLRSNLTAEPFNYNANTIRVAFKDNNPFKAQAVLNKIDTLYLQYSNEQKNLANKQKIDWLTNELGQIEKKMEDFENYFEDFTIENKTNNLDQDLKNTIESINRIDSQRFDVTRRLTVINQLIDGLGSGQALFPTALLQYLPEPLSRRLEELQQLELELERLKLSYNEITFTYRQKQKEIENLKNKNLGYLKELNREWLKNLQDLNRRKSALEIQFANMPDKNTQFTKNQRFYKLYEEFYLTLMQSKSEFEIAQAGTVPDFKILSPASFSPVPIAPRKLMITGAGVISSLVLIFFFIGILYIVNNKITNLYELERIETPVLGAVPMSRYVNNSLHILDHPKSMVSEAIRTLRTNLDFINVSAEKKIVAISSTVSGEGKSFIAMNLGGVVALSKKKVVLIDLDMRKAKLTLPANNVDVSKGVSTILIKRNTWEECVVHTALENLDFIPSGPHPPNPSELLLNGEFNDLLADLKKHYDFIILDTPPVGLVTDAIMAMKRADVSIYVFRANYSKKEFMLNLRRIISINKFSNITTLLNAVPSQGKTYGYGYYEDNGRPRKLGSIFKT